jgi:peptidoglycan/xylan/chitin deacetylase (PgdA/CDA1 family)
MNSVHSPAMFTKRIISKSAFGVSKFLKLENPKRVVLCYHSVGNNSDNLTVPALRWIAQINRIKQYADIVPLSTLLTYGKQRDTRNLVAITIDDGYTDFLKLVPFIIKNSIPVTLFALSNPAKANKLTLGNNRNLLSRKDIQKLSKLGITIGCHSATHENLSTLDSSDLIYQIKLAKKDLEKLIGKKVDYFAYPNGAYSERVLNAVKKAGFVGACTVESGFISSHTDHFELPRIVINANHSLAEFPAVISSAAHALRTIVGKISAIHI